MARVDDLFYLKRGDGEYIETYRPGSTPLVSARTDNNGIAAFVDAPPGFKAPSITVERVSGMAFVQLMDFSAVPADVSVLVPKKHMDLEALHVVAGIINNSRWRFSYNRKLTPTRLRRIEIPLESFPKFKLRKLVEILPKADGRNKEGGADLIVRRYASFKLGTLFDLHSGDYHKSSSLPRGDIPIVSCGDANNGISDYRNIPDDKTYSQKLTIAYNGMNTLTTKYHPYKFGAKDDVAVAFPKTPLKLSTLIFIQFMLNREMWRFSYYRKCFNEKLRNFRIQLPVDEGGKIDEEKIVRIMRSTTYWRHFEDVVKVMKSKHQVAPKLTDYN